MVKEPKLNNSKQLISHTLRSMQLCWLPVLTNIALHLTCFSGQRTCKSQT